ncbi:MAG: hypothetical protein D0531_09535 [Methylococcales bacterium]|nr:MAG: hypothetical protein D0531_09535 [Methylococcales bacterium]
MYAIEFEANIDNGIVKIPKSFYKIYSSKKAKVIIMVEDTDVVMNLKQADFIETFSTNPRHIDPSTSFLSREQANER